MFQSLKSKVIIPCVAAVFLLVMVITVYVMMTTAGISEELTRLSSHLTEFRLEAERNSSPGKKLDFLCQEINREINTVGSKTPVLEVSRAVVEMKNALENIREQLRNVE